MTDAGVSRFKLMVVSDLQLLQLTLQRGAGRFVAIIGPSGSGKSSLLHAGLLPRLQRQPERWMLLPPLVPGRQPMRNLARALAATFASTGDPRSVDDLEASLQRGASSLVELALQLTARRAGQQKVLVVVDQAEELVTLTGVREQHEFLRLLDGAMSEDSPMWAVATVRSEFLSTAPERAGLAEAVHESVVVEPLSRSRLWDVASLRPRGEPLKGHTQSVYKVSFSRDGRLLASASIDGTVRLWDLPTGRPHGRPLIGHTNWVHSVAFSPYGKLLASSGKDQTIRLRDVATGRAHGPPITGHTGEVWDVAFSHDGRRLASASADQTVRLWDVATSQAVGQPLTGHTGTVAAVAFSRGDDRLATASWDHTARLWNPGFHAWLAYGCKIVGRNLSSADWNQFVRGRPYERTCPDLPSGADAPIRAPAAPY